MRCDDAGVVGGERGGKEEAEHVQRSDVGEAEEQAVPGEAERESEQRCAEHAYRRSVRARGTGTG